jgi:glucan 1,3-beta-glucosidase
MNQTLLVLQAIATQVCYKVSIIEVLNEIAGYLGQQWADAARQFWQEGFDQIREVTVVNFMIGDAFLGLSA